ncbi:ribosome biogenesis GTPase Der [Granulicella tundricola]|uniref:GTPase Der n=1 Tax=Granulicella tundricola (strain ATCC BAA-1859 / DSM 23138 / MP5ACTX9) TaxID=1198114 RepID=E8X150_GRATM|nr:ribosome biogenesis GTPase Der [Granulicella tundricola]ADW67916.1 ribosome-associated GTPase EngA [Granulicella tundricola MP5ACTX9]
MAAKKAAKRLGKKHRQASTRPHKGKAPKSGVTTGATRIGAVDPKKRKIIATKKAKVVAEKRISKRSPEFEAKRTITGDDPEKTVGKNSAKVPQDRPMREPRRPSGRILAGPKDDDDWREAELAALQQSVVTESAASLALPLIAVCGRPNVGKSTLFNRLTGSRRSIVGDEPGITRDRIYGEIEWQNVKARLVDTGGVVPDDEALIPSEIFRQAQVALQEADAIVMVVDGRTELASPDMELARLLMKGGKPTFLAVNKMDSESMYAAAENFRRLGFKNVLPISAEHGSGIGDLLDEVFAVLPEPAEGLEIEEEPEFEPFDEEIEAAEGEEPVRVRTQRTHGEYESRETKVAIIGRPNVGKSTLLNALTETDRAIVSPIAGTTRDAVDEIVEKKGHIFRFVDTAGIRKKGKTKMMAEKLSVIMARKHLEAADVSLLVIDAQEGVTNIDANIGGYAHESGRSVIIVINKWDLVTTARTDGKPAADQKAYAQQVRDALKYLDYAPLLFISAGPETGGPKAIEQVFAKVELVARERRKRVSTGMMNKFLDKVDFQRASVPMNKRVKIYYMTQAQVAPPTFVLFTDRDIKMHFSFERFLANQIREAFGFIGSPIWFKIRARNKKKVEE